MISRNEENVSSTPQPAGPNASTAFDPARTRHPLPSGYSAPAIGYGTTTEYRFRVGDRPKNPVGFSPPADSPSPRVFRTEVSFKRHPDVLHAGGSPSSLDGSPQVAWSTRSESEHAVEASCTHAAEG